MNRAFVTVLVSAVCFLSGCSLSRSNPDLVGKEAPQPLLTTLEGELISSSIYRGKTTVVLFWAEWCGRSQRLIRKVNSYAGQSSDNTDLVFLAVNVDKAEKIDKVKATINDASLDSLKHFFSGNEAYDEAYISYGAELLPALYIISPQGTVVANGDSFDVMEEYFHIKP